MDSTLHDLSGANLNGLKIIGKLGAGGMGEVWRGHDQDLDIPVAVKVLPLHLAEDQDFLINFIREARAVARLDHPNIVRIFQAGKREFQGHNLRILVMEFMEGSDALQLLHSSPEWRIEPELVAQIGLSCAKALKYAHANGVIHRDIKPANIFVSADHSKVKVLDFGIAKVMAQKGEAAGARASNEAEFFGTPLYMSPEQIRENEIDGNSDTYSLGITLFELLAGIPPFDGESMQDILPQHLVKPLPVNDPNFEQIPPFFRPLLEGMCAKNPINRTSLEDVVRELEGYLGQSAASTESSPESQLDMLGATNLTPRGTSFVGRESELSQIGELFSDAATKLVSVLGPGGVGKTRITQEFGLASLERFLGGVVFCDLTEARSADEVAGAVAKGLGIAVKEEAIEEIHAALKYRQGETLLILDNFEQVTQHARATIGVWMSNTPHVQFLASSREPLHLEGETSFVLGPLESTSTQLFVDRAALAKRDFALTDANQDAIASICKQLDGIPLAIELAAARSGSLTPQMILERLPRRFDLLKSRRQDASQRQLTLRGAIDWSWNLLKPWEQSALAQCSVFQGGFFLDAAESVIDLSAYPDAPFEIDVIEALVEKSLLTASAIEEVRGETRYRMLESVRQYAEERLMEGGTPISSSTVSREKQNGDLEIRAPGENDSKIDTPSLFERHAAHYLTYTEHWNLALRRKTAFEAMNRIELEVENLYSLQDSMGESHPALGARAILALAPTLLKRGPAQQLIPRLNRAFKALEGAEPILGTRIFVRLTEAHRDFGQRKKALAAAELAKEAAFKLTPSTEAKSLQAEALVNRGWLYLAAREYAPAIAAYDQAEVLAREISDVSALGQLASMRADAYSHQGQFERALELYAEAEAVGRERGDAMGVLTAFANRGNIHLDLGEYDAAIACFEKAETLARAFKLRRQIAIAVSNRGDALCELRRYDEAMLAYERAEQVDRQIGFRHHLCHVLHSKMMLLLRQGMFADAVKPARECLALGLDIQLDRAPPAFFAHAGLARASWGLAKQVAVGNERDQYQCQAHEHAKLASDLGTALKIPRKVDHGEKSGEILEFWLWIEEVLGT